MHKTIKLLFVLTIISTVMAGYAQIMEKNLKYLEIKNCYNPVEIVGSTLNLNYHIECNILAGSPTDDRSVYTKLQVYREDGNLVDTQFHQLSPTRLENGYFFINQDDTFEIRLDSSKYTDGRYTANIEAWGDINPNRQLQGPVPMKIVSCSFSVTTDPKGITDEDRRLNQAATLNCQNRGGKTQGTICKFYDGSYCDLLDLYRGECSPSSGVSNNPVNPQTQAALDCFNQNGVLQNGQCVMINQLPQFKLCQKMGGTYKSGWCRFPDGSSCPDADLYGTCQVNRALACANQGGTYKNGQCIMPPASDGNVMPPANQVYFGNPEDTYAQLPPASDGNVMPPAVTEY